jgi:hypothetical protein
MDVLFIASVAIVTPEPAESRKLFMGVLGLPLKRHDGDDYFSVRTSVAASILAYGRCRKLPKPALAQPPGPPIGQSLTLVSNSKLPIRTASPPPPKS